MIASVGLGVVAFGSAAEFLESEKPDSPACLVLDLQLPDVNGLELQRELAAGDGPPIVFITGHGDIPSSVRAIATIRMDGYNFSPRHREHGEQQTCFSVAAASLREISDFVVAGNDRRWP